MFILSRQLPAPQISEIRSEAVGELSGRRSGRLRLPSVTSLLSVPVLVAFGLFTSPARAIPAASMQLFRVDGKGVKPLPAVSAIIEGIQASSPARLSAQPADASAGAPRTSDAASSELNADSVTAGSPTSPEASSRRFAAATTSQSRGQLLAQASESAAATSVLSQTFTGPLPPNLSGNIRLVTFNTADGTLGNIVEEIPFSSSNVSFSPDRTQLFVRPSTPITPGQSVMMQLPSRSLTGIRFVYPNHLVSTPCVFEATAVSSLPAAGAAGAAAPAAGGAAAAAPAAAAAAAPAAAAAAAASIPVWAIVAGVIVVGVGVAAASGAFSSGGGGGGTNPSSQ